MELMNQSFVVAHAALRQNQDLPPPGESERDRLILEHLEQVHLIARRIHERLPQSVNLDDMVSAGVLGLIAAVDQYDSTHGVKLSTYAEYKIKGAVLDSLRGIDWAPRKQRRRAREIEAAVAALEQDLQRTPFEEEVADRLGVSVSEYQAWLCECCGLTMGSLDAPQKVGMHGKLLQLELEDVGSLSPSQIAEREELEQLLTEAILKMPKLQQTVLYLYYYEELTLRQIADKTGLHESRISQLKSRGIVQLRSFLQPV
jgi:RNA polymerase sigma factor for flagellar operon FliA